jgi:hypothetical protein
MCRHPVERSCPGYNTSEFWIGYPHREIPFQLKLYYLLQASYWLQQTICMLLAQNAFLRADSQCSLARLRSPEKTSRSSSRM